MEVKTRNLPRQGAQPLTERELDDLLKDMISFKTSCQVANISYATYRDEPVALAQKIFVKQSKYV